MNIITKWIGLILTIIMFEGCNIKLEEKSFIGIWTSNDGAVIEFKEGNIVQIKNIDMNKIFFNPKSSARVESFEGKWSYSKEKNNVDIDGSTYHFAFEVIGQGALGNKPPYNLVSWIRDPDDMIGYEFEKKKEVSKEIE